MKPKVMQDLERKVDALTREVMSMSKKFDGMGAGKTAGPKVTKKDLMDIDGVGPATADKILKLLK